MQKKTATPSKDELNDEFWTIALRRFAALSWGYAVGASIALAAALAGASQLWEYPYPRGLCLQLSWATTLVCIYAGSAYLMASNAAEYTYPTMTPYQRGVRIAAFLATTGFVAYALGVGYSGFRPTIKLYSCAHSISKGDLCNLKASDITPEAEQRIEDLLASH